MTTFTGFVGESPEGLTRIYLIDDPHRYVDVAPDGLASASPSDQELVLTVALKDGVESVPGHLDDAAFHALFTIEDRPQEYSSFYHTTKFWKCEYTISVC